MCTHDHATREYILSIYRLFIIRLLIYTDWYLKSKVNECFYIKLIQVSLVKECMWKKIYNSKWVKWARKQIFLFLSKLYTLFLQWSIMISQEMCPIRHKNLGKCIYLLFVWLIVIGFRQNYFYLLPNFGDFGAKMSFFH